MHNSFSGSAQLSSRSIFSGWHITTLDLCNSLTIEVEVKLHPTVTQSVSRSLFSFSSTDLNISCFLMWGTLSDEWMGLKSALQSIFWSKSLKTYDHTLLSHSRLVQLEPWALGSLSITFMTNMNYGRGILAHPHAQSFTSPCQYCHSKWNATFVSNVEFCWSTWCLYSEGCSSRLTTISVRSRAQWTQCYCLCLSQACH